MTDQAKVITVYGSDRRTMLTVGGGFDWYVTKIPDDQLRLKGASRYRCNVACIVVAVHYKRCNSIKRMTGQASDSVEIIPFFWVPLFRLLGQVDEMEIYQISD